MPDNWKHRPVVPKQVNDAGPTIGWYSRGYIPHFDGGELAQTVTFRLFDSMPQSLLDTWRQELSPRPEKEIDSDLRKRIDAYLDKGIGSAWMRRPVIAAVVQGALLYFDGSRYRLQAWVVMPNHVHALLTPMAASDLGQILHSWKSYTSKQCNKLLGRNGEFWQPETWDRYVRDERHYYNVIAYIENNPVKARLCERPEDWQWSSARRRSEREGAGASL